MFWGLIIEPRKHYAQTVGKPFHVSMACLETNSNADGSNEVSSVMLNFENLEYILCNLHKQKALQCQLDLNFKTGDKIAFFSSGKSRVHLTGYILDVDDDDDDEDDDEIAEADTSENEMDVSQNSSKISPSNKLSSKRKNMPQLATEHKKKAKVQPESEDEDDDDDDDDLFDDDDDEVNEEESDDEIDESDESEDDEPMSPKKTPTPDIKNKNKQSLSPLQLQKNKSLDVSQEMKKKKTKSPNEKQLPNTPKTPVAESNGTPVTQSGKKNKKKGNETPVTVSPKGAQTPPNTPVLLKKTVQGGVGIEDVKLGAGPVAKPGRRVTVYYVGRLKNNNKQFDATTQGPGFKFNLGSGEVIKGWDVGVAGMRVGGKRKITCPPGMAYGDKGSPPVIPSNSTLVFDVELKGVN